MKVHTMNYESLEPKKAPVREEQYKHTLQDQIQHNSERLDMLEKHLNVLGSTLTPVLVNTVLESMIGCDGQDAEPNSQLMQRLIDQTAKINEIIRYVEYLNRDIQL